jgi:4-carboxymuconolactone decarboxylase
MTSQARPRIEPVDVDLQEPLKSRMATIFPSELPSPNLYRSVARNESLFIDMIDMRFLGPTGLMDRKTIPPRQRELLILRTCTAAGNEYEFNLHERTISEKMGLTKAEIDDLKNKSIDKTLWPDAELSLIALVDELVRTTSATDPVFERALEHFPAAELIEMTQLVGLYTSVAMLVSLIRPETDPY